jgi:hypothetical protein
MSYKGSQTMIKKPVKSGPHPGISVRFLPAVKAALEKAAAKDSRPLSSMVQKIVADYLRAEGFLK